MLGSLLSPILGGVLGVIDKAVEDKDQRSRIKARVHELAAAGELQELEQAGKIITAEAQGESWLQRTWRPAVMLTFTGLIVARWLGLTVDGITPEIELVILETVKIGLGGYVVGRSAEKVMKAWKQKE